MAVALFGGSFDPPHNGHLEIVQVALQTLDVEKIIVLPTFLNPFKSTSFAPSALRLLWLKKLFKTFEKVEVSDYESAKEKSTYTIESVRHFKQLYDEIYFIIGADNLEHLEKWHKFDELNTLVTWVVAHRDDIHVKASYIPLHVKMPISSSSIRESFKASDIPAVIRDDIQTHYKGKK